MVTDQIYIEFYWEFNVMQIIFALKFKIASTYRKLIFTTIVHLNQQSYMEGNKYRYFTLYIPIMLIQIDNIIFNNII